MHNIFNNKGHYYIEVLISIFIITIFFTPILSSFYYSYKNIDYTIFNYKINLINNSILNEVENTLLNCKEPENYLKKLKNNKLHEFLNITEEEFNEKYEDYIYFLSIDDYIFQNNLNNNINYKKHYTKEKVSNINYKKHYTKENINNINYNEKYIDELIKIKDNDFKLIKTKGYVKLDKEIKIDIKKEESNNITVFIDMKETKHSNFKININNDSNKLLTIIINKKENTDLPFINYNYDNIKNNKNIFLEILNYDYKTKIFNICLEIYNKNNNLIKKTNKNIILKWKNIS